MPSALLCLAMVGWRARAGPIYSQVRMGRIDRDGTLHPFRMYKFRSMYADADERLAELLDRNEVEGAMFKMRDDPRVTRESGA